MRYALKGSLIAFWLIFSATMGTAEAIYGRAEGSSRIRGEERPTVGSIVDYRWAAEVRLGSLMGEPVVSARFRFDDLIGIVTIPHLDRHGVSYTTTRVEVLPKQLKKTVNLIDVKLRMRFSSNRGLYDVVADVGVVLGQGKWSFNVPGSPEWGELFRFAGTDNFVGPEMAKELMRTGVGLIEIYLEDATLNLHDFHAQYMKTYGNREEYRVLGEAYQRLEDGLQRSYGIDLSNQSEAWSDAYFIAENQGVLEDPEIWGERKMAFSKYMKKLMSLPDTLRAGDNHGPYDVAVEDASRLIMAAKDATFNFAPAGQDPAEIPEGYLPEFDSIDERLAEAGAQRGASGVSLIWESRNDLDLYVHCSDGSTISYRDKSACGGHLDVDANASDAASTTTPIENAYWDVARPKGSFRISVKMHSRRRNGPRAENFQLQVRTLEGIEMLEGQVSENTAWHYSP